MPRSHLLSTAALTCALALGCGEQQSPMAPLPDSPTPSLRPDRATVEFGFGIGDDSRTMIVGASVDDVVGICEGGPVTLGIWEQQTVTRPTGREGSDESFQQKTRGKDLEAIVFEAPGDTPLCDLLLAPQFEGTAQAIFTDNDLILTHHGANAFNFRATGTVSDESGQLYHLVAREHHVLSQESTLENFIFFNQLTKIQLTPIGR